MKKKEEKNWLFFWKMTCEIWWILTRVVESPKIWSLMCGFCQTLLMFELKIYRRLLSWKMTYGLKNDIRNLVKFHTSGWRYCYINPLYIMFSLRECDFWTKTAHEISTFWTFHCLPEVSQIPHVIFETRSKFL